MNIHCLVQALRFVRGPRPTDPTRHPVLAPAWTIAPYPQWQASAVCRLFESVSSTLTRTPIGAGDGPADRLPGKRAIGAYEVFIYLQLLDLLTTLLGFRLGAAEASPVIRMMMRVGPATGVIASKVLALGLGALCVYVNKAHVIRWISYWYGVLVIWNLAVMLVVCR